MQRALRPRGRWPAGLVAIAALAAACAAPPKADVPRATPPPGDLASYFPLETDHVFSYATREGGSDGMLVARAKRTGPDRGELRLSNAVRRFVYRADGVAYDGGAYILKAPLTVGTSWPGEHGGTTRVTSIDKIARVVAGSFAPCVETVEEGGRVRGARYTTTYCPGVGLVLLEVSGEGRESARAELRSHGPAVDLR